jgi:5'-3' exonuclease
MGGYINDGGKVDMKKLEILLAQLADKFESELFETEIADANFLRGKQEKGFTEAELIARMDKIKLGSRKKGGKNKLGTLLSKMKMWSTMRLALFMD